MPKILCCDLSLTGSAFAVLVFEGSKLSIEEIVFVNNKKNVSKGIGHRLDNIVENLADILDRHQDIEGVVRERGFTKFPSITQALFRVVGVVDLTLFQNGFETIMGDIPPTTVKKLVAGSGKASKEEVEEAVRTYLSTNQKNWEFETDDCSDAVAVGIAWGLQNKILMKGKIT